MRAIAKKILGLEKNEGEALVFRYRILILICGPIYALGMQFFEHVFVPYYNSNVAVHDDILTTPFMMRLFSGGTWFFLLLTAILLTSSAYNSRVKAQTYYAYQFLIYLISIHFMLLVNASHLHKLFVMGTFVLVFSVSYMMATARSGAAYVAFMVLCSIVLVTYSDPQNSKDFFVWGQVTIGIFAFVTIADRRRLELKDKRHIQELTEGKAALKISEENIRLAVDATGVATWHMDLATNLVTGSPQYFTHIGLPEDTKCISNDEIMSKYILPEDLPILNESFARVFSTKKGEVIDYRMRVNGEVRWFQTRGYVYATEKGEITRLLGTTTDITDKKRVEFAERNSREQLELAMESGRMGSWDLNLKTNILEWSASAHELFGSDGTITHEGFFAMLHENDRARIAADVEQSLAEKRTDMMYQFRFNHKTKGLRHVMDSSRIFYDKSGVAVRIIGISRDVTEAQLQQEQIHKNAALLRETQTLTNVGSWELDLITDQMHWSEQGVALFELPSNISSREMHRKAVHPDDLERVLENFRYSVANNETYDITYRLLFPDGRIKHVHGRGRPVYVDGKAVRSLGSIQEVTKEVELLQAIRDQKELTQAFLDAVPDPIFLKDDQHRWIDMNVAFCNLIGKTRAELMNKDDRILGVTDEELKMFWAKDDEVMASRRVNENEETFSRNGVTSIFSTKKTPLTLPNGEEVLVGIIRDITAKKESEQENEKNRQLLVNQAQLSALGEMAAGIAHEIFTPVTGIKMRAQIIKRSLDKGKIPADLGHLMDEVKTDVDRCATIIAGLKMLSRDSSRLPQESFKPAEIVNQSLSLCRTRLTAKGIKLSVDDTNDPALIARGMPSMVSQVMLNLLNNAMDAVADATGEKSIAIRIYQYNSVCNISVEDSGSGIPMEVRDKIFKPFFTTKEIGKGTGLGLSISKSIMETHGGNLKLISAAGEKTRFLVSIPMAQESEKAA